MSSFFLNLSATRALSAFLISFVGGFVLIYMDIYLPWTPIIVVLFYGLILLISSWKYEIIHSSTTINSTYFLGFLFTLSSLFVVFFKIDPLNFDLTQMTVQIGVALTTTIAGLVLRHVLCALSLSDAQEEDFYKRLQTELRMNASEYHIKQQELLRLLEDFTASRKSMFEEEEAASQSYLKSLYDTRNSINSIFEEMPPIFTEFKTKSEKLTDDIAGLITKIKSNDESLSGSTSNSLALIKDYNSAVRSLIDETGSLANQISVFKTENTDIKDTMTNTSDSLLKNIEQLNQILNEFVKLTKNKIIELR